MSFKTDYKFLAQLTDDFDGKIKGFAKDYLYYKNIPDDVAHISNRARAKMKQRSSSFNNGLSAINGTKSKQKHKILYNYDLESPYARREELQQEPQPPVMTLSPTHKKKRRRRRSPKNGKLPRSRSDSDRSPESPSSRTEKLRHLHDGLLNSQNGLSDIQAITDKVIKLLPCMSNLFPCISYRYNRRLPDLTMIKRGKRNLVDVEAFNHLST